MKTSLKLTLILLVVAFISSCNDMNDGINKYMENGERLYMGKLDSVKTFAGQNRFMISFYLKDPRVDTLAIYWNQKGDSILLPIAPHSADSLYKVNIGGGTFPEGNSVLQFICKSRSKYKSMVVESSVNVYGARYQAKLTSRYYNKAANCTYRTPKNSMTLSFGLPANQSEIGIMLRFFNKKLDAEKDTLISSKSISDALAAARKIDATALYAYLTIPNVVYDKVTKPVTYRTLYLPEATAIDTFYTKRDTIQTLKVVSY
jgi:hypothetical protein